MPLHPGWSPDGITGNWIVFHLLWKRPERDTPRHSPPVPALFCYPPSTPQPPFSTGEPVLPSHYGGMSHRAPKLSHVIQSFALRCRIAGPDVSRVLNKAAACTIPAAAAAAAAAERPKASWCITLIGCKQYALVLEHIWIVLVVQLLNFRLQQFIIWVVHCKDQRRGIKIDGKKKRQQGMDEDGPTRSFFGFFLKGVGSNQRTTGPNRTKHKTINLTQLHAAEFVLRLQLLLLYE